MKRRDIDADAINEMINLYLIGYSYNRINYTLRQMGYQCNTEKISEQLVKRGMHPRKPPGFTIYKADDTAENS